MHVKRVSSLQMPTDGDRREVPAWGFLLYFPMAPAAPKAARHVQTAALKDPDQGLPQNTSHP